MDNRCGIFGDLLSAGPRAQTLVSSVCGSVVYSDVVRNRSGHGPLTHHRALETDNVCSPRSAMRNCCLCAQRRGCRPLPAMVPGLANQPGDWRCGGKESSAGYGHTSDAQRSYFCCSLRVVWSTCDV